MVQFDTQTEIWVLADFMQLTIFQYSKKVQIVIDGGMQESC